mgnify:CR=1 FL=1
MFIKQFENIIDLAIRFYRPKNYEFVLIDPLFASLIGYFCESSIKMLIKERKKDYLVYLLWLFGVIPLNILKNYIVITCPTLRAPKVLYLIE